MRTFTLRYQADSLGFAKTISFTGVDPHAAFAIAEREGSARHAELWEGDLLLGEIQHLPSGVWKLS